MAECGPLQRRGGRDAAEAGRPRALPAQLPRQLTAQGKKTDHVGRGTSKAGSRAKDENLPLPLVPPRSSGAGLFKAWRRAPGVVRVPPWGQTPHHTSLFSVGLLLQLSSLPCKALWLGVWREKLVKGLSRARPSRPSACCGGRMLWGAHAVVFLRATSLQAGKVTFLALLPANDNQPGDPQPLGMLQRSLQRTSVFTRQFLASQLSVQHVAAGEARAN